MEEISFLTATVLRLDAEIGRLNETRAALLRRLNAIRPTTRHLPPETLALIFFYAAQHNHISDKKPLKSSPLLIGSVCSHWRQIAWSTPTLWTHIDPVPIRRNAQLSDAHLLRLYFTNARALPVSIHIKLDRLSSSPSTASEEILRAVFIENSPHIAVLNCSSKSSLRQRWAMLAPKLSHAHFPNLHSLDINLRGAPLARYDSSMFIHAPRLERVSFSGYHLPHEIFWSQITVLEFSALPVSQCLETLVKCPRLIEFRCTSPRQSHRPLDLPLHAHTTVSLDHLIKFEWIGALVEWDIFLYSIVRLPNLRHLVLGNSHPLSRPLDPTPPQPGATDQRTTDPELWKRFLRHTKSLTTLECTVFHSAHEWLDIFDIFSSTLHTLKFTAFRDADETIQLLRALQLSYHGPNYLPNLKFLFATIDLHPDRSKLILDILCSRRLRPILSSSPTDPPTTTSPDNASTTSSSSTSTDSQPPTTSLHDQHNDYFLNPQIDLEYWNTHTRLEEASIKCWPFGFEFGEREKKVAKLLKEDAGLKLDVFGQSARVEWL